jgi:LPS-assembly lipoprotein
MGRYRTIRSRVIKKKTVIVVFAGALCLLTAACGFRPLYSQDGGAGSKALASVTIAQINDRSGQKLRNYLLERMAPSASARESKYSLKIELNESKSNINIRKDESATRANLSIRAKFTLTNLAGGGGIFDGTILSTNSYNVLDSDFATLSAENDARTRALRSLAEEIRLRVATALRNPSVFSKPAPATSRRQ